MTFFTSLFNAVDAQIALFLNLQISQAAIFAAPFITTFATIVVIGFGIAMMYGKIERPAPDMIKAAVTIAIVTVFATNLAIYNLFIRDTLIGLPDDLLGLIGGGSVGARLDAFGDAIIEGINRMWRSSTGVVAGLKAAVAALIMFIIWAIMSAAAVVMLLLSRIGLSVLVAVGPVFIGLAVHPATREYFSKWLSYCTNFAFLAMLIGGVLTLITSVADTQFLSFSRANGQANFVTMAAPAVIMLAVIGLFSQLPNIASSLGGGIGLTAGNFAGDALSRATSPLRDNADRVIHRATGGERRDAIREVRQAQNRAKVRNDLRALRKAR